jgi:hypothetical protein
MHNGDIAWFASTFNCKFIYFFWSYCNKCTQNLQWPWLLSARREIESQATQILALEAALLARPELPPDAPENENEKDCLLGEQARNIRELEAEEWATELARALEKEKKVRAKPRSTSQA